MSTSIIILLCVLGYVVIGCLLAAALMCVNTHEDGTYLDHDTDFTSMWAGAIWPLFLIYKVLTYIFGLFEKIIKNLYSLCFKLKTGKYPKHSYWH